MALILIVDDEANVRQVLKRWIEKSGHEVLEVESADAALQIMEKRPADVVFCDIQMPEHDGLWLTIELRKRHANSAVVLATAISTVAPRTSMQAGVLAYLVKPFNRESVIDALEGALAWHADIVATGPHAEDTLTPQQLEEWLDSLE